MAATTVTTLLMVLFACGVLLLNLYAWFGSWQPVARELSPEDRLEAEYEAAVREMRAAIERYERGD